MSMIATAAGVVVTLFATGVGWFIFEFFGRPLRKFFDLRQEVHRQLLALPVAARDDGFIRIGAMPGGFVNSELQEASQTMRDLASQLEAFGAGEWPTSPVLRFFGFDPQRAADEVFDYADDMLEEFADIRGQRRAVLMALKLDRAGQGI